MRFSDRQKRTPAKEIRSMPRMRRKHQFIREKRSAFPRVRLIRRKRNSTPLRFVTAVPLHALRASPCPPSPYQGEGFWVRDILANEP